MSDYIMPPEIFDRRRRRALRERAGSRGGDGFLWDYVASDLHERLNIVTRTFNRILLIGPIAAWQEWILPAASAEVHRAQLSSSEARPDIDFVIEEGRLCFDPASFDLVISAGTLDSVNDLPGALIQIRRILEPDGLFLGHMFGAGTLVSLKSILLAAEGNMAAPHIHPQIDLRSAADLLTRAGFALPVADQDIMSVIYRDWRSIVSDLRDAGIGNALAGPRRYLGRNYTTALDQAWRKNADDLGKVTEYFTHLYLSGWAPSSQQPRPARRGSGQISLAAFLPGSTR
jgi:NADH dehydrogenase [ubiquinone] 1 alpha subcomplex assembly factor 5